MSCCHVGRLDSYVIDPLWAHHLKKAMPRHVCVPNICTHARLDCLLPSRQVVLSTCFVFVLTASLVLVLSYSTCCLVCLVLPDRLFSSSSIMVASRNSSLLQKIFTQLFFLNFLADFFISSQTWYLCLPNWLPAAVNLNLLPLLFPLSFTPLPLLLHCILFDPPTSPNLVF